MKIFSDPKKDVSMPDKGEGGYEWWYFDAVDPTSGCSVVIIFYDGNPFSRRYVRYLEGNNGSVKPLPSNFPAISISVYRQGVPIYYSFTEYEPEKALFGSEVPNLKIGRHSMIGQAEQNNGASRYHVHLEEELPSGDAIYADLTFKGDSIEMPAGHSETNETEAPGQGHLWNLVQPRAEVTGTINLTGGERIAFQGTGYHDHNTGYEPMKEEFVDWYWGRYHFPESTLVYYVMNRRNVQQHSAWLIGHQGDRGILHFSNASLSDYGLSLFGLKSARKISFAKEGTEIIIQQSTTMDNGPFYQRFGSEAYMKKDNGVMQKAAGLSEYIHPERIYWRLFWPLVNMRIRYRAEGPHWVQKSKRLYRWTW
ncbi:MAG: hypothetical protein R3222_10835 [Balneolaceae bacterium]|nr:hypothetical protein [Balneolaceae bacterium]